MKRAALIAAIAAGSLGLLAGGVGLAAFRSLPDFAAEAVAPVSARVEIVRDAHALPHIYAQTREDAYFALGYVHAQDRLWQMELHRRAGSGTLAEVLGARALEKDKLFRTLGVVRAARAGLAALDRETRAALDAYARGVNAWLEAGQPLPPEFELLRFEPSPWRPVDSLVLLKVMAWRLSGNWGDELWRVRASAKLSADRQAELSAPHPGDEPIPFPSLYEAYQRLGLHGQREARSGGVTAPDGMGRLAAGASWLLPLAPANFGRAIGSNNWVVDGTRTRTHKPLLANDPHLALTAPSQWYLAHLAAPGLNVIGATLPGVPGVILGRNDRVAWAFTNTYPDTQDLFVEKLTPEGSGDYQTPEGPAAFERVRERIRVRGEDEVDLSVRISRHGPIISDVSREARQQLGAGYALALSWTGLQADDRTLSFPIHAAQAASADQFVEAASGFHAPVQNIVYADVAGSIGFLAAGKVPLRRFDNELKGLVPAPGWLAAYDWQGTVPFEELPQQRQPASGRIVTANQNIAPAGYTHWLGADWGAPYRAERITHLLDARPEHTLESFAAIQRDLESTLAERVLGPMLNALPKELSADERAATAALARWNREMHASRAEPLLFAAWLRELERKLYQDELGNLFEDRWVERPEFVRNVLQNRGGQNRWCDDLNTLTRESCATIVRGALRAGLAYLTARFGSDRRAWSWGKAHASTSNHPLFGSTPVLSRWFSLAAVRGGDSSTIDVGSYALEDELAFRNGFGPGLRAIYDLSAPERSVAILNTGQSGHVLSRHYRDMNRRWAAGQYVPLITDPGRVSRGALGTTVLRPNDAEARR